MSYQPKVYRKQGGAAFVVRGWDGGAIEGQASAGATPAQASHIVDVSVSTIAWTTGDKAKVNTLFVACENAGLLKRS